MAKETKLSADYKEVVIDEQAYTLRLMPAIDGLNFMSKMQQQGMSGTLIFEAISKCVAVGSTTFTEKRFNDHFKGKYGHLMKLVDEVVQFNFPDLAEGNEEGDTDDL